MQAGNANLSVYCPVTLIYITEGRRLACAKDPRHRALLAIGRLEEHVVHHARQSHIGRLILLHTASRASSSLAVGSSLGQVLSFLNTQKKFLLSMLNSLTLCQRKWRC